MAFIKEPPTYADSSIQRMKEILEAINQLSEEELKHVGRLIKAK